VRFGVGTCESLARGLLFGDFKLEQRGEFYDVDEVFVQRIQRM
jgi:hypothetical protein